MTVTDFLVWLAAGGAAIAVSWIAERFAKFQALEATQKKLIQYGASILLAVAAFAVNAYVPKAYLDAAAPYFTIIAGLFGTFFLNQASHSIDPARTRKS